MADLLTEAKFRAAQIALAQTQARLSTLWDAKQPLDVALSQFEATLTAAMAAKNKAADDLLALASGDASALPEVIEPSSIDSVLRTERFAGKAACVDYVKANPTCSEADAITAWTTAGEAATGLPFLLQDAGNLAKVYQANLLKSGATTAATWEAQRGWLIATPKDVVMGA